MIILNIYGILAIVVISFVGFYLHTYWPSLYEGSYFGLTLGVLTLLVGSVMERMGARGRIFFMPVWLVGVLLTAYAIFLLWGVAGLILPAILVIIAVWWLTKVIKKNGIVLEQLMGGQFKVELEDDKSIAICTLAARVRRNNIKVLLGDKVQVEFSPYDLTRGRISYRYK